MKRFLHLVREADDREPPVDPDLSLAAAYVSRELSVDEIIVVEDRLRTDGAFRDRVQFVLDCAALPISFAHEFGVAAPAKPHAERAAAQYTADQLEKPSSRRSIKRVAAIVIVTALPVVMLAQVVLYVANRSVASGLATARTSTEPSSLDAPVRDPELNDAPLGRQLQAVPATQQPGRAGGARGVVAGSAGQPVGEYPVRAIPQALPTPDSMRITLRIGGTGGGGHALNVVTHIATSARGLIFLAQPQDGQISVFDTLARAVGRIGRRGKGPGEFTELNGIGVVADTLWATDFRSESIHLFSLAGTLLDSRDFSGSPRPQDFSEGIATAYLSGGSALMRYTLIDRRTKRPATHAVDAGARPQPNGQSC